mgnify:CR=1 FL=1
MTPITTGGTNPAPPKTKKYTLLAFAAGFIFLIFVKVFFFPSGEKNNDNDDNSGKTETGTPMPKYSYTKPVSFDGDGTKVTIPSGFMVSIIEASDPYCLENLDGSESGCSVDTEDISSNDNFTSDNPNNRWLRFRSQSGKKVSIMLLLRSKM